MNPVARLVPLRNGDDQSGQNEKDQNGFAAPGQERFHPEGPSRWRHVVKDKHQEEMAEENLEAGHAANEFEAGNQAGRAFFHWDDGKGRRHGFRSFRKDSPER